MSSEKDAKLKALKLTLDKLDKAYGKGTVMRMSDAPVVDVEVTSSGSLGLDIAIGVGGYQWRYPILKILKRIFRIGYRPWCWWIP